LGELVSQERDTAESFVSQIYHTGKKREKVLKQENLFIKEKEGITKKLLERTKPAGEAILAGGKKAQSLRNCREKKMQNKKNDHKREKKKKKKRRCLIDVSTKQKIKH